MNGLSRNRGCSLGAENLRSIDKGCSFDAIAELSGMSISTMQPFFHFFWNKFCEVYRETWIKYPKTREEAADNLAVYRRLGFPGAVVSVDCLGEMPCSIPEYIHGKGEKGHRSL